jgi:hypothetical protein
MIESGNSRTMNKPNMIPENPAAMAAFKRISPSMQFLTAFLIIRGWSGFFIAFKIPGMANRINNNK